LTGFRGPLLRERGKLRGGEREKGDGEGEGEGKRIVPTLFSPKLRPCYTASI